MGVRIIFAASLIFFLAGCKSVKNRNTGTAAENVAATDTGSGTDIEDVYLSLPLLGLPLEPGGDLLGTLQEYSPTGETVFRRLTGIADTEPPYRETSRVARLPEKDGVRFILAAYTEAGGWVMELYSLNEDLNPTDRLRIYSEGNPDGGEITVKQTSAISSHYRIEVSKRLNGTLIERLTYIPASGGIFEELRDGKTATVAYDSYDGVNYIVETFVWARTEAGGLVKKDLRTENYRIDAAGRLVKTGSPVM